MIIDTKNFIDKLIKVYNIDEAVGVPCSNLKYIINELINRNMYKSFTNEGDAVAYAAGKKVADPTHNTLVLMQNSGIGNAINPITSLVDIYELPMVFIIGERGVGKDEPQHKVMGEVSRDMMNLSISYAGATAASININEDVYGITDERIESALETYKNYKYLMIYVRKNSTSEILLNNKVPDNDTDLDYESAIDAIVDAANTYDIPIVSTTGFTSRVLYGKHKDDRNFYSVGSMGCAYSIAQGISKVTNDYVICIDGDGAFMMRPSSVPVFITDTKVIRIILCNDTYKSTGGQSLLSNDCFKSHELIEKMIPNKSITVSTKDGLSAVIDNAILGVSGVQDILVPISNKADKNLPRPTESSVELLNNFRRYLDNKRIKD